CAGTYPLPLALGPAEDGVQIFGGLDCAAAWGYVGNKAVIAPTSAGVALTLQSLNVGVSFTDVEIDALPASAAGGSSIAVFGSGAKNVAFARAVIKAGDAQAGANGGTASNHAVGPAPSGQNATSSIGGFPGQNGCNDDSSSTGGTGATAAGAPADD